MSYRSSMLPLATILLAGTVAAADPSATVRAALQALTPNVQVETVQESVVPGFYEALAGGQFVYVSKDGRFVLDGSAFDVAGRRDLGAETRARMRKSALERVGPDKRIVFAPEKSIPTRHTITVFTDPDCPFCRRFHQQIAQYNAQGIAVDYLLFPLSIHPEADRKSQAVWCSSDRVSAFNRAMAGQDPGKASCPNPVSELARFGKSLGIGGTPTILASDGTQIPPQLAASPAQLAAELDRLAVAHRH